MDEAGLISATTRPATPASLLVELRRLGVGDGDIVIVHSSMKALGWVAGGAQAVVEALLAAVGPTGTVVMPSQSSHLSDPASWVHPPVPADWIDIIREHGAVYDPALTPTRAMGQVVECFRAHPGTRRSAHPTVSFVANGPDADRIVGQHPLTPGLGDCSPLGALYDVGASVLQLGVGDDSNTSLHLAEHRADWPGKATTMEGVARVVDGERRWVVYEDLALDTDDFVAIGDAFASTGLVRFGEVGVAEARRAPMRALVDFAVEWMAAHRGR